MLLRETTPSTEVTHKICNKCGELKLMSDFGRDTHGDKYGKKRECKVCHNNSPAKKFENPVKKAARGALRRAYKIQATPVWLTKEDRREIGQYYEESASRSKETNSPHEVDHIVPLNSPFVCGLHWAPNLQVLDKNSNQEKSNRWWPDMPDTTDPELLKMAKEYYESINNNEGQASNSEHLGASQVDITI